MVISWWPWCIFPCNLCRYLYPDRSYWQFFRNWRWRPPRSWIFSLCEFGHSGVLIMRYLCSLSIFFQIYVTYSHTYASDIHLMTSRELTSGFDFWSRSHFRMAVMHLLIQFGTYICIQSGVIDIFPKFKMAAAAILYFQFIWIWTFRRYW